VRRFVATATALVLAAGRAACGGDDEPDASAEQEEARQVTEDAIAAMKAKDFETFCELSTQEVNEAIATVAKTDTCAEGYPVLFEKQGGFGEGKHPFDDFIDSLADYEVGEATATDTGAQVKLNGPQDAATLLEDEDGELKVSELFVTPNANSPGTGPTLEPDG
jgi:hypothetical protein